MTNCTNCGAPLEPDAAFCVICGAQVSAAPNANGTVLVQQAQSASPSIPSVCHSCGAPLEPGAAFCVVCGATVSPTVPAAPAPMPVAPPVPSTGPAAQSFTTQLVSNGPAAPASASCPKCGAPVEPDAAFCVVCGTSLGTPAPQPQPAPPSGPLTPVSPTAGGIPTVCPNCGTPVEADADFCVACGKRIPGTTKQGTELGAEEQDMRTQLVFLTRQEAQHGCTKLVEIDGRQVPVDIPPGTNGGTDLDIPGYGYPNDRTGKRGVLRLNFFVS